MIWGLELQAPKKVVRIITLNTYISHTEPLFKKFKLLLLKVKVMLKLQELKLSFKYIYKQLPPLMYTITILVIICILLEFAMKCLRYSRPHTINDTPDVIKNTISIMSESINKYNSFVMSITFSTHPHHHTLFHFKQTLPNKHEIDILNIKGHINFHHEIMVVPMTATLLS